MRKTWNVVYALRITHKFMLIDISTPIQSGAVFRIGSPAVNMEPLLCIDEHDIEYETTVISMPAHTGTHIDLVSNDRSVELHRMISRAWVIDVTHAKGGKITRDDIGAVRVQPNDSVLFRTDWSNFLDTARYYAHPELMPDVVDWLIECCVNIVGIDALGLGQGAAHGDYDRMLAKHDIYVLENLTNLAAIPQNTCTLYCFPLPIDQVDAIPARVVAEI